MSVIYLKPYSKQGVRLISPISTIALTREALKNHGFALFMGSSGRHIFEILTLSHNNEVEILNIINIASYSTYAMFPKEPHSSFFFIISLDIMPFEKMIFSLLACGRNIV